MAFHIRFDRASLLHYSLTVLIGIVQRGLRARAGAGARLPEPHPGGGAPAGADHPGGGGPCHYLEERGQQHEPPGQLGPAAPLPTAHHAPSVTAPACFVPPSISKRGGTRYIFSLLLYLAGLSTRVSVRI